MIPTNLITNSLVFFFWSFIRHQKHESNFQEVRVSLMKNISVFWIVLSFRGMLNSIDFCKNIFLHVVSFRMIVSCYKKSKFLNEEIFEFEEICIEKCKSHISKELININDVDIEHLIVASKYFFRKKAL